MIRTGIHSPISPVQIFPFVSVIPHRVRLMAAPTPPTIQAAEPVSSPRAVRKSSIPIGRMPSSSRPENATATKMASIDVRPFSDQ
jgi:hypothetical protein